MGRSSKPNCKVRIKEDGKIKTHSWNGGDPIRVYAKVDGMKALPYWFCRHCGNILDNDGVPVSRSEERIRSKELESLELRPHSMWRVD